MHNYTGMQMTGANELCVNVGNALFGKCDIQHS